MNRYSREQEEAWIAAEREKVIAFIAAQHIDHLGVGDRPAFHIVTA